MPESRERWWYFNIFASLLHTVNAKCSVHFTDWSWYFGWPVSYQIWSVRHWQTAQTSLKCESETFTTQVSDCLQCMFAWKTYPGSLCLCLVAGLAVDWINDKVYWADSYLKGIYEYDLKTKLVSSVFQLDPDSIPSKLKIFPQTNNR